MRSLGRTSRFEGRGVGLCGPGGYFSPPPHVLGWVESQGAWHHQRDGISGRADAKGHLTPLPMNQTGASYEKKNNESAFGIAAL